MGEIISGKVIARCIETTYRRPSQMGPVLIVGTVKNFYELVALLLARGHQALELKRNQVLGVRYAWPGLQRESPTARGKMRK